MPDSANFAAASDARAGVAAAPPLAAAGAASSNGSSGLCWLKQPAISKWSFPSANVGGKTFAAVPALSCPLVLFDTLHC